MAKLKVFLVITKSKWGGASRYVYDLALELKDKYEIKVVYGGQGLLADKLTVAGIPNLSLPRLDRDINFWSDFMAFASLLRLLLRERPDIVHLNSSKIGGLGALAVWVCNLYSKLTAKSYRLKAIFTAHGWAFNEERPTWQKKLIAFSHWLTARLSHRVICVCRADREQVRHWPWVQHKFQVIHNGVSPVSFYYRDEARQSLASREPALATAIHRAWLGIIAELHHNKGLDRLVRIITEIKKRYPEVVAVVIGEGEKRLALEQLIRENGLEENLFLLGRIDEAARYLKAFDIFVLTSRKEGLPYVILEAGLAELAVVAPEAGGVAEIVGQDRAGVLINPADTAQTATQINQLLANSLEREILGRNLEQRVRRNFSLEQMVRRTEAVYNNE